MAKDSVFFGSEDSNDEEDPDNEMSTMRSFKVFKITPMQCLQQENLPYSSIAVAIAEKCLPNDSIVAT